MAQTPAPGVQLYLYQLLTQAFGTGRQALLPKVEEALTTDGIEPGDLECADVRELMDTLDFATITTFKGGRVYVTFAARPDFDEALATLAEAEGETGKAKKGGKPWKHKRAALKPVRPQKHVARKPKHARKAEDAPVAEDVPAVEDIPPVEDSLTAEYAPADEGSPIIEDAPSHEEPEEPPVARTLAEILAEARAEEEAARAAEEAAAKAAEEAQKLVDAACEAQGPAAEALASESTRTQDADSAAPSAPEGTAPEATHEAATPAPSPLPRSLPVAFWDEVRCPDELLAELANLLPLDVDAHTLLEEDWKVARATGSLWHEGATAGFDLRYVGADGAAITVSLERGAAGLGGKRWAVVAIEGSAPEDAAWMAPVESSLASEGAWADLSASRLPSYLRRNLLGEFAEAVSIGSWEDLCCRIAMLSKPEPWGPEGTSELPILREYLLVSLTRALEQERIVAENGTGVAIWNTGLVTRSFEPVCCLFGPVGADGTRPLTSVCAAEEGQLPGQQVPLPASYLEDIGDLLVPPGSRISVAPKSHIPQAVAATALRRAIASWREAVPVWDPQERRCKLLLPASTTGASETDVALVAERDRDDPHTLLATRALPLDRAYTLARVVADVQPAWLAKAIFA